MPIKLSRRVARFNKAVNNRIQGQYAWLLPPWVVLVHRGRKSGRTYRTPVNAFKRGNTLAVMMLYGDETDWARNMLAAGGGEVVRGGRTYELVEPRVIEPADAGPEVARLARGYGRVSGKLFVARLGERRPGWGRGPAAAAR